MSLSKLLTGYKVVYTRAYIVAYIFTWCQVHFVFPTTTLLFSLSFFLPPLTTRQSARKAKADAEAAAVARENHIRQLTNERDAAELARRQAAETARQAQDQVESSQKELKRLADLLKDVTAAGERERQRAEEASQKATDSQGLVEVLRGDLQAKERTWQSEHAALLGEIEAKKGEIAVLMKEVEMSRGRGGAVRGKGKTREDEAVEEDEEAKRSRKEAEKMTIMQLKNAITEAGGGAIVLELRNGPKAKLVEAYLSITKK